jgi:hypothetical protein
MELSSSWMLIGAIVVVAVGLDVGLLRWIRSTRSSHGSGSISNKPASRYRFLANAEAWLFDGAWRLPKINLSRLAISTLDWATIAEVGAILAWACWVGRDYLNLDPAMWPVGNEFSSAIQTHFVWYNLFKCGSCVFWNGTVNGGAPAFAELHGSLLYPLVVVSTLIWGVLSGAKLTLVASLMMAGIAQWWIARIMGLGRIARIWVSAMVIVGGHIAGRMELGAFGVMLSIGACSLVLAAALDLALTGRRRSTLLLGVTLGLALLAGQAYMQFGMLIGLFPPLIILLIDERWKIRPVWKEFAKAFGVALLLSAVLWVPLLHFWPNFVKPSDVQFQAAQPLEYAVLNLVIRDIPFFTSEILGKLPYPYLNTNYVGWVPIILAVIAFRLIPRSGYRLMSYLIAAISLVYLTGSAVLLKMLVPIFPNLVPDVRNPPQIFSMAVPAILALSAWGLDLLLRQNWPVLRVQFPGRAIREASFRLTWLVLAVPIFFSIQSAYDFGKNWLVQTQVPQIQPILTQAVTPSTQWTQLPFGEHFWVTPGLDTGLKLTYSVRAWSWKDRAQPAAYREVSNKPEDLASPDLVGKINGVASLIHPKNEYASVQDGTKVIPCSAYAAGGDIDVTCSAAVGGVLVVQENTWSGWYVSMDGHPASLMSDPNWLMTQAPAGRHQFSFRYRPWDAPLGICLSLIGVLIAIKWWRESSRGKD